MTEHGRKYYRDVREHLKALEERGKLLRIKREINKDTELMPLVRWQFRGLQEEDRKAFFFENVVDVKGKKYAMPVSVGTLAASTEIYSIGLMCRPEEIAERWTTAQLKPIPPVTVKSGPVHEMIWQGEDLLNGHGLDTIPVPISTPGFDNAPYLTSANWVTKDPETGIYNIGNYRGQIKASNRAGGLFLGQHMGQHWRKCIAKGIPLQAAIVIDATRPWPYPPVSLPRKEFMEKSKAIWEELGLPALKPRMPWYGYSLGAWTKEDEEEAETALKGEHFVTGEKAKARRVKPN